MRTRYCVGVTRALAASIIASLALLCVPTLSSAAESGGAPAEAAAAGTALSAGDGYGQPQGDSRVRSLQRRLRALGQRPGPVDGLYGPRTKAAVEGLQRDGGLAVDGIVGPRTRRVLNAEAPPLAPGAGYEKPGGSPQVREVQRRLRAMGSRPGPVDGVYGPRTEAAVERFQRSVREPATGVLSTATAGALARAGRDRSARANTDGSEEPRQSAGTPAAEPAAGEPDLSSPRPTSGAEDRVDEKDGAGSAFPLPLVVLALALVASGGLIAIVLVIRRRRRPESSRAAAGPVEPAPMPNGHAKAVAPGNGSSASNREPRRQRDGALALGYVSSRDPDEMDGPELRDQIAAIDAACLKRGLVLSDVIRDLEKVEDPEPERPGMQDALQRLAAREASCLVVTDLGQLSRSAPEVGQIVGLLREREARLVAVDEGLDTGTKPGAEAADELVSVGAAEQRHKSPRSPRRGPRPNGRPAGSAGRGSRAASNDVPALEERVRAMRAHGMTLQAIADRLNAENVPPLSGGTKWRPSAVQQAIRGANGSSGGRGKRRRPTSSPSGGAGP